MSMLVDCSNCCSPLVLPPGAKSIRCSLCQFITSIAPSPSGYSIFPGLKQSSSFDNHAPSCYSVFPGLKQSSSFDNHALWPSGYFPGLQQSSSFYNHAAPVPTGYQVHTPALTHSASFYTNYVPPAGYGRKMAVILGGSYKNTRHEWNGSINYAKYLRHIFLTKFCFPESEIVMITEEEADPKRIPTGRNMSSGHYEWGDYLPKSNYDSTSEQLPNSSPLQAQSVVLYSQNHPSESSSNIDNSRDDMSGYGVVIPIKDDEEEEQRPPSLWVHAHEGISEFLYVGFIVGVLPSLIGLNQLKFQNKSPSKTDGVLFYMAAVALAIVMLASIPILYMRTRLDSTIKKTFYTILKSIFCFSCILAPLSLVLMLIF